MYNLLRNKLHALYRRDQFQIHERIVSFHDILKERYTNARDYLLFHLISGSTFPGFNGCFDFPTPDSIAGFIEMEYLNAFGATAIPRTSQALA